MDGFFLLLKAVLFGILEGVTEWLPISSTGHIILLDTLLPLTASEAFYDLFEILIQLGAILAVGVLFFHKLNPFSSKKSLPQRKQTVSLWGRVLLATVPSGVIGLLLDEKLDAFLRSTPLGATNLNTLVVAAALILYGAAFLLVEKTAPHRCAPITPKTALAVGLFQCLSLIPGTSRSGATILGALLLGVSRQEAAEFSFFLAIPTMLGAGFLKLLTFWGTPVTPTEVLALLLGSLTAFFVSVLTIRKLMDYVRNHSFALFGIYRILLGGAVLIYFLL